MKNINFRQEMAIFPHNEMLFKFITGLENLTLIIFPP
jgi:hypothetical protein